MANHAQIHIRIHSPHIHLHIHNLHMHMHLHINQHLHIHICASEARGALNKQTHNRPARLMHPVSAEQHSHCTHCTLCIHKEHEYKFTKRSLRTGPKTQNRQMRLQLNRVRCSFLCEATGKSWSSLWRPTPQRCIPAQTQLKQPGAGSAPITPA